MNTVKKIIRRLSGSENQKKGEPYQFISWLRFANAGMLDNGNIYCFEYAIKNLPSNNPVIEIGSFCGLSTNLISFYLQKFSKTNKLITCDKWIFEGAENPDGKLEGSELKNKEYKDFVKDTYIRNISFFSKHNLPYTFEQFSDELFELWENKKVETDVLGRTVQLGGPISFAYIDGNHEYDFAKKDFEHVDKFLEPGGFILFDDSADDSNWDVKKVVREVQETGRYELIVKNPNYLFKKIK